MNQIQTSLQEKISAHTDSISMGFPLGPSIFEFYLPRIENKIFNPIKKDKIYVRYVDDIFIVTQ